MANEDVIHILAVDDEQNVCILTREFLSLKGEIDVTTVNTVDEAWKALSQNKYDAIVSDYYMPGENGIQFLKALRAAGDMTPFVLLTCREREEVVIEALNLGADAYIHKGGKPVPQYVELEHLVREAVEKRRKQEELRLSEARFRELAELLPAAVFEMDLKGNLTYLNQHALRMFGYTSQDFERGISFTSLFAPKETELVAADMSSSVRGAGSSQSEYAGKRKDGGRLQVSVTFAAILRDDKPVGLRGIMNDITERRREEESQRIRMFRVQEDEE
jgi:PAS domain S-box-containing protein